MIELNQRIFDAACVSGNVSEISDCRKIQQKAAEYGIYMTMKQAEQVWEHYSDTRCAQWLNVREEEVEYAIKEFIRSRLEVL